MKKISQNKPPKTERADKLLALCSGRSRSDIKALIKRGSIKVDGAVLRDADVKIPVGAAAEIDGQKITLALFSYIIMNKPAGYLSAVRDRDAPTVMELLPKNLLRRGLFVAGRLDKDSEGMLLITDDGDFAHRILSPRTRLPKKYFVICDAPITGVTRSQAEQGMTFEDGSVATPAVYEPGQSPECACVTIYEGFYHQVKRMFAAAGNNVKYLRRIKIGGLDIDESLKPGESRELTLRERELIETF